MFDMATVTSNLNLNSPMGGGVGVASGGMPLGMGNLTPQTGLKYEMHSPAHSPISTPTPSSTPNSIISNAKSISNSSNKDANEMFGSKCKRKINFSHLECPKGHHQPATVQRRNARERNRVKQVNNGFAALKQHIPLTHRAKKMSKVETLRCAVEYIRDLKDMLDINGALLTSPSSSNSGSESDQTATQFGQAFVEAFSHSQHFNQFSSNGQLNNNNTTVPAGSHQLSPSSSEDPSSPSYASEASSYITSSNNNNNNANVQYDYENYEPVSPEDDEELLDAISWWQQS